MLSYNNYNYILIIVTIIYIIIIIKNFIIKIIENIL